MNAGIVLIVVGLVVLGAANAGWWWLRGRSLRERVTSLTGQLATAMRNAFRLSGHVSELEAENASLKARNEMLAGLVGADAERAALQGSCADEARWL
ncbi:hypothetical protein Sme01_03930 [Sphaerisporangium melleum]|uniref:Uncharacterized protein n=1 Tax=Sphaerisporangium melleum TaxID=321316 RepID=A0A917QPP2_9ACTN|nr:hypothetical protein [Sphaerisporangium melleum]GGK62014.1 hypothetical protein GCM10007964_01480 [Sphaerisporangium melleum]GII67917.1 hypothetical protein Sme01_03930 [Sphaerisporangium melleum]